MSNAITELTTATFDELVLESSETWLIDFWAEWCRPCHVLIPALEELAASDSAVRIGKVDVTQFAELGERFEVQSVPTLVLFRNGDPVSRLFGAKTVRQLRVAIDRLDQGDEAADA